MKKQTWDYIKITIIVIICLMGDEIFGQDKPKLDTSGNKVTLTLPDGSKYNVLREYGSKSYIVVDDKKRYIIRRENIKSVPIQFNKN